jgi:hypothetical protein
MKAVPALPVTKSGASERRNFSEDTPRAAFRHQPFPAKIKLEDLEIDYLPNPRCGRQRTDVGACILLVLSRDIGFGAFYYATAIFCM